MLFETVRIMDGMAGTGGVATTASNSTSRLVVENIIST
jgi:hypothetical protein